MKHCIVCGLKLNLKRRSLCPNADTCDPLCTRAKHTKRTRQEQIEFEVKEEQSLPGWHGEEGLRR